MLRVSGVSAYSEAGRGWTEEGGPHGRCGWGFLAPAAGRPALLGAVGQRTEQTRISGAAFSDPEVSYLQFPELVSAWGTEALQGSLRAATAPWPHCSCELWSRQIHPSPGGGPWPREPHWASVPGVWPPSLLGTDLKVPLPALCGAAEGATADTKPREGEGKSEGMWGAPGQAG